MNEKSACTICHQTVCPHDLYTHQEAPFHRGCFAQVQANATYNAAAVQVVYWKGNQKIPITIEPEVQCVPMANHQVRLADEFDVAAGSR